MVTKAAWFPVLLGLATAGAAAGAAAADAMWTAVNPTGREYADEPIRLKLPVPPDMAPDLYRVKEDGREVPYQTEEARGTSQVWVAITFGAGQTRTYSIERGRAARGAPKVAVKTADGQITLDNGKLAVRLPARAEGEPPCPLTQVRLPDGRWVGRGSWRTTRRLTNFTARVVGDGTVFGKVRLQYDFEGRGGPLDQSPAFCQVDVTLQPGKAHLLIEEAFAMGRDEAWEFDAAAGWAPRHAVVKPHFGGFGRPEMKDPDGNVYPFPPTSLKIGQTRMHDTLINLLPRWSQAYDDGWLFAAADESHAVAALVCRAGRWVWPHDSIISVKVRDSADYAGLRCFTRRGARYWYLAAGPRQDWQSPPALQAYLIHHGVEGLDKLYQEYILEWPGLKPPSGTNMPPAEAAAWANGAGRYATRSNPFVGWGPAGNAGFRTTRHPLNALTRAQAFFDPDMFGDYWLFWSPENPNFASHWIGEGFYALEDAARYPGVREHPLFARLLRLAEMKAREEMYHSVTLPSGAGQECFGYMSRGAWAGRESLCRDRLGVDPKTRPWLEAAARFIFRASHPVAGGGRKSHPGGDTHPPGPDVIEGLRGLGLKEDVTALRTEELEGYGVIFRNRAGTPEETYLGFKSGPNRGHFHGDGLSFHYCAYGRPQVVDHHCSYAPRAGQEHMHNRLAFRTDKLPWANMDGYERLIAFKTSAEADVAVGQVESERLRITEEFPPEKWDWDLPQERFDAPLAYRRTVVMMRGTGALPDYFVFRDQYAGPDLYATYCLHAYGDTCERKGPVFDFDPVRLTVVKPSAFEVSRHDWKHANGGLETTKGLRLTVKGREAEFITVLMPKPLKRAAAIRLVLKDALKWDARGKSDQSPVWRTSDVVAVLTDEGGKLHGTARFLAPGLHPSLSATGTVTATDTGTEFRCRLQGALVSRGLDAAVDYAVRVTRDGQTFAGDYEGALTLSPAKNPSRSDLKGAVQGERTDGTVPPIDLYAPVDLPKVEPVAGGVRVGDDEVVFAGGLDDDDRTVYVSAKRNGRELIAVTGRDVDMNRSQGEIGLFVPDAGYPFGEIPDWLLKQRCGRPNWYRDVWPPTAP